MKLARVRLQGLANYSQNKPIFDDKLPRETANAFELRTWQKRAHLNSAGQIILPAMGLKNCLAQAAKYTSEQIPGRGKATFTKHFESAIMIFENSVILSRSGNPLTLSDLPDESLPADEQVAADFYGEWVFVPADGVAGSGKRVNKKFPVIAVGWSTELSITITDDIITKEVFAKHMNIAGLTIGIGRWRVRNRGMYGMFKHTILDWQDDATIEDII
jgi:hypothetical protein